MFERFTEGARRAIFFARYEASQYGKAHIETEHLLLGLLREPASVARWFPNQTQHEIEIRTEIEKRTAKRERIATSVQMPLTRESQNALQFAGESAERLGHFRIEPVHLLLGLLRVEGSLAAQILVARGLRYEGMLEAVAKEPRPNRAVYNAPTKLRVEACVSLEGFLSGLRWFKVDDLIAFFAENAEFVDVMGKRWNREEMSKNFETLFAAYAKKNATYSIESTIVDTNEVFIAVVLWKNALVASLERAWMHRMSLVLVPGTGDWEIVLVQVTPIQLP